MTELEARVAEVWKAFWNGWAVGRYGVDWRESHAPEDIVTECFTEMNPFPYIFTDDGVTIKGG